MSIYTESMYGLGHDPPGSQYYAGTGPTMNISLNAGNPSNPIGPNLSPQDAWWFRGPAFRALKPLPGAVSQLPAGGSWTVDVTCHPAWSSIGWRTTNPNDYYSACPDGPGPYHADPNALSIDTALIQGCAIAIADVDDIEKVTRDNLVIMSVQPNCVRNRLTTFDIPADMPKCTGSKCICGWFWEPATGTANFYMTAFDCSITGSKANAPKLSSNLSDPVFCPDADRPCAPVIGAKRPIYAYNSDSNVPWIGNDDRVGYLPHWGYTPGAQNDIFATATRTSTLLSSTALSTSTSTRTSTLLLSTQTTSTITSSSHSTTSESTSTTTSSTISAATSTAVSSSAGPVRTKALPAPPPPAVSTKPMPTTATAVRWKPTPQVPNVVATVGSIVGGVVSNLVPGLPLERRRQHPRQFSTPSSSDGDNVGESQSSSSSSTGSGDDPASERAGRVDSFGTDAFITSTQQGTETDGTHVVPHARLAANGLTRRKKSRKALLKEYERLQSFYDALAPFEDVPTSIPTVTPTPRGATRPWHVPLDTLASSFSLDEFGTPHLVALSLTLLVSCGIVYKTLHTKNKWRLATSKQSKKRQTVVKTIQQAQSAAASNAPSNGASRSTSQRLTNAVKVLWEGQIQQRAANGAHAARQTLAFLVVVFCSLATSVRPSTLSASSTATNARPSARDSDARASTSATPSPSTGPASRKPKAKQKPKTTPPFLSSPSPRAASPASFATATSPPQTPRIAKSTSVPSRTTSEIAVQAALDSSVASSNYDAPPASSSARPAAAMKTVSVQTSPRLGPRPAPFDLHAMFQATPPPEPLPSRTTPPSSPSTSSSPSVAYQTTLRSRKANRKALAQAAVAAQKGHVVGLPKLNGHSAPPEKQAPSRGTSQSSSPARSTNVDLYGDEHAARANGLAAAVGRRSSMNSESSEYEPLDGQPPWQYSTMRRRSSGFSSGLAASMTGVDESAKTHPSPAYDAPQSPAQSIESSTAMSPVMTARLPSHVQQSPMAHSDIDMATPLAEQSPVDPTRLTPSRSNSMPVPYPAGQQPSTAFLQNQGGILSPQSWALAQAQLHYQQALAVQYQIYQAQLQQSQQQQHYPRRDYHNGVQQLPSPSQSRFVSPQPSSSHLHPALHSPSLSSSPLSAYFPAQNGTPTAGRYSNSTSMSHARSTSSTGLSEASFSRGANKNGTSSPYAQQAAFKTHQRKTSQNNLRPPLERRHTNNSSNQAPDMPSVESTTWTGPTATGDPEVDRERLAKELEIARWKLTVLEDERLRNEMENQEALNVLVRRAQRAEAKLKAAEQGGQRDPTSSTLTSPVMQTASLPTGSDASATGSSPPPFRGDSVIDDEEPMSKPHPLSYLDLDAVKFGTAANVPRSQFLAFPTPHSQPNGTRSGRKYRHGKRGNKGGGASSGHTSLPQSPISRSDAAFASKGTSPKDNKSNGRFGQDDEEEDDLIIILDDPRRAYRSAGPSSRRCSTGQIRPEHEQYLRSLSQSDFADGTDERRRVGLGSNSGEDEDDDDDEVVSNVSFDDASLMTLNEGISPATTIRSDYVGSLPKFVTTPVKRSPVVEQGKDEDEGSSAVVATIQIPEVTVHSDDGSPEATSSL